MTHILDSYFSSAPSSSTTSSSNRVPESLMRKLPKQNVSVGLWSVAAASDVTTPAILYFLSCARLQSWWPLSRIVLDGEPVAQEKKYLPASLLSHQVALKWHNAPRRPGEEIRHSHSIILWQILLLPTQDRIDLRWLSVSLRPYLHGIVGSKELLLTMNKKSESKQFKVTSLSLSLSRASSVFEVPGQPSRRKNFLVTSGAVVVCWLPDSGGFLIIWPNRYHIAITTRNGAVTKTTTLNNFYFLLCRMWRVCYLACSLWLLLHKTNRVLIHMWWESSASPPQSEERQPCPEWMNDSPRAQDRPTDRPPEDGMLLVVVVEESRRRHSNTGRSRKSCTVRE